METYSLHQLNQFIRRFVALNLPEPIWLEAELAEVDERRGHYFLSLIEKDAAGNALIAKAQAVMWAKQAHQWQRKNSIALETFLQAGRLVKLQVKADFHEQYGLKFVVQDIDRSYTLGQLALQKEKTINELKAEGLWQLNQQAELSIAPQRLAIISAPMAAGLQDFLAQLKENEYQYQFHTQFFPAAMQGVQLSTEIRRQIRLINRRRADFDAIVIIRGGGARMDLLGFDDKELCAFAAMSYLPIITGIGHDSDQSILDMIVHTSLKTPTAVADFFIQRLLFFEQTLLQTKLQIDQRLTTTIAREQQGLDQYVYQLDQLTKTKLIKAHAHLDQQERELSLLVKNKLAQAKLHLQYLSQKHELLSMENSLKRGFSILSQSGKIISSKEKIDLEQALDIHFKDGTQSIKAQQHEG